MTLNFERNPSYSPPQLFYWVREKSQAQAEVDYIAQIQNHIVPIEVKAGKTGTLKSVHYFMCEKERHFAVRFNADIPSCLKNAAQLTDKKGSVSYELLSLPFYLAEQLGRLSQVEKHLLNR